GTPKKADHEQRASDQGNIRPKPIEGVDQSILTGSTCFDSASTPYCRNVHTKDQQIGASNKPRYHRRLEGATERDPANWNRDREEHDTSRATAGVDDPPCDLPHLLFDRAGVKETADQP